MATWNPVDEWTTQIWRVSPSAVDPTALAAFAPGRDLPPASLRCRGRVANRLPAAGVRGRSAGNVIGALQIPNAPSGDE